VTVLLVSSTLIDAPLFRVTIQPDKINNIQKPSQVMVDKAMTVKRDKLGEAFGSASDEIMLEVGRCLAVFLGIAR
jgi:mRNA interferase MazF